MAELEKSSGQAVRIKPHAARITAFHVEDVKAHIDGDEFAIHLPDANTMDAEISLVMSTACDPEG